MDRYTEDDDDDRRILADGQAVRVPMFAMDSLQREVAGLSRPLAQHQPAFASDSDDDFLADAETMADAEAARQEAYAAYDHELTTAWQQDADRVTERDPEGREVSTLSRRKRKVTRRDKFGRVQAEYEHEPDKADWEVAGPVVDGVDIYDVYDQEISNAWRTDE
jgi:hypothetical protein